MEKTVNETGFQHVTPQTAAFLLSLLAGIEGHELGKQCPLRSGYCALSCLPTLPFPGHWWQLSGLCSGHVLTLDIFTLTPFPHPTPLTLRVV